SSAARSASPRQLYLWRSSIRIWPQRHGGTENRGSNKGSKDEPLDSVPQEPGVEIYLKADLFSRRLQIFKDLGLENRVKPFDTLDFHNHGIFHEKVQPIFSQGPPLVKNWE